MSFSPVPDYAFNKLTDISADFLKKLGIRLLMLDLDNTVAPYGEEMPAPDALRWAERMAENGVALYFVSNNRGEQRVKMYASAFKVGYVKSAHKPLRGGLLKVLDITGCPPEKAALAGDQVYTDVIAANAAGVTSIAVRPLVLKNPFLAARYGLEIPFRAMCANKMGIDKKQGG